MPHIQITMLEGRTPEQKRKLAERVTQAVVEEIGTSREAVTMSFVEVSPANYAAAGILALDKKKT
jgi:4-oxalocrotonate tautomerase